jgi:predicted DNA-binding transcriptional regulator AlpA
MTASEVADLLGLSVRHVRRLRAELGGFHLGRRVLRFDPHHVEAWIAERKAEAT